MPDIDGHSHIVLVVSDARHSADWYCRVFGFVRVTEGTTASLPDPSAPGGATAFSFTGLLHMKSKLFLGLAQLVEQQSPAFELRRVGIQHFGFHVPERADLETWSAHLDVLGIPHSAVLAEGTGYIVRFQDPDGLPLEVYWPDLTYFRQLMRARVQERRSEARAGV